MTPPDLNDPAQLAAYRTELRGIAWPLRMAGILFSALGLGLAVARMLWWPDLPTAIPMAAVALGLLNMLAGIVLRTRYHQARMKRD